MSRIGNRILEIPSGVTVNIEKDIIKISGKNGILDIEREAADVLLVQQSGRDWFENMLVSWGFYVAIFKSFHKIWWCSL